MKDEAQTDLELSQRSLAVMVMAYARLILAGFNSGGLSRGGFVNSAKSLATCRALGVLVRRHIRVQHKLRGHALRAALARSPAMRARVQRELGGRLAMVKWERRRREVRVSAMFQAAQAARGRGLLGQHKPDQAQTPPPRKRANPRKAWQAPMDEAGHFRLAVIPVGPRGAGRQAARAATAKKLSRGRKVSRRYVRYHPVQTTPQDLSAHPYFSDGFGRAAAGRATPSGHAPPIFRPPI